MDLANHNPVDFPIYRRVLYNAKTARQCHQREQIESRTNDTFNKVLSPQNLI